MNRAHELLPIERNAQEPPSRDLSPEQRQHLDVLECFAPAADGTSSVRILVYQPRSAVAPLPMLYFVHGGAFCFERADSSASTQAEWAIRHTCTVASVDYRRAPEHPFPAAAEDCYAGLQWCVAHLTSGSEPVAVAGVSSGGALAAALTLMARDRDGPTITFQALIVPALDDRLNTPSIRQFDDGPAFALNARHVEGMWLHYLGETADRATTSPYAAPARATNLGGLPPAYVQVHGSDPLRDEGIDYAKRLLAAGTAVELHCIPNAHHTHDPFDARHAAEIFHGALGAALSGVPSGSHVRSTGNLGSAP